MSNEALSPIEEIIREARIAIQAALRLIDQQEDGPASMRAALNVIKQYINEIDTEAWYMQHAMNRSTTMTRHIRDQRDELLAERDALEAFIRCHFPDPERGIDSWDDEN